MLSERDEARISFLEHYLKFLGQRVGELEHRVYGLEMEVERMNRDQLSLIFLCTVATTLCMTLSIAMMVLS